uniref:Calx domain-containing protein n=1 Tax=Halisarca dujardinii TaxID=2583056 RepID=A0AA96MN37_HALDU|nr:calx domain-containing protein [Halisarca dujardinii]
MRKLAFAVVIIALLLGYVNAQLIMSTIQFTSAFQEVSEGDGTVEIVITADMPVDDSITLTFTVGDITTDSSDYNISGTFNMTFANGITTNESIPIDIGDTLYEEDESFILMISKTGDTNDNLFRLGAFSSTVIVIKDNDTITVSITNATTMTVPETGSSQFRIPLTLDVMLQTGLTPNHGIIATATGNLTTPAGVGSDFDSVVVVDFVGMVLILEIKEDDLHELDEALLVTITSSSDRTLMGASSSIQIIILDDDPISLEFAPLPATPFLESDISGTIRILSNIYSQEPIVMSLSIADVTTDMNDYNITSPVSITLDPFSNSTELVIEFDDYLFEMPIESFNLTLGLQVPLQPGIQFGSLSIITVEIMDDEVITAEFTEMNYDAVEESEMVAVQVNISIPTVDTGSIPDPFNFTIQLADGSATIAGADYVVSSVNVSMTISSSTVINVTIPFSDDDVLENNETIGISLTTGPDRVVTGADSNITINNNDSIILNFRETIYSVMEGELTELTLNVTDGQSDIDFGVELSFQPITANVSDYSSPTTMVTFSSGSTCQSLMFQTVVDNVFELNETVSVVVLSTTPANVVQIGNAPATIIIEDDEVMSIKFEPQGYSYTEDVGNATLLINITLPADGLQVSQAINLTVSSDNGTTQGAADFMAPMMLAIENLGMPVAVGNETFVELQLMITLADDDILEATEMFTVTLGSDNPRILFDVDTAMINITNDDAIEVKFNETSISVNEEDVNTTVTVFLVASAMAAFEYNITIEATDITTSMDDRSLPATVMTILPGTTVLEIPLTILHDLIFENDEVFSLNITETSHPNVTIGGNNQVIITIRDNEMISITVDGNFTFEEGDDTNTTRYVTASSNIPDIAPGVTIPIQWIITPFNGPTGLDSDDYFITQDLIMELDQTNSSQTELMLAINIVGDQLLESDEIILVEINSTHPRVNITMNSARATVLNDDALEINFNVTSAVVDESQGNYSIVLIANGTSEYPYTVVFQYTDISTDSNDYIEVTEVEFLQNTAETEFQLNISDYLFEDIEEILQINFTLRDPTNLFVGADSTLQITIRDDEVITAEFSQASYMANEDSTEAILRISFQLPNQGLGINISYGLEITDGTAISPDDYDSSQNSVLLQPTTSASATLDVIVPIVPDTILERDQDFTAALNSTNERLMIAVLSSATVTITDDDILLVNFQVLATNLTETVGLVTILVGANTTSEFPYNITTNVTDLTTSQDDYIVDGNSSIIKFNVNSTYTSIVFAAYNDEVYEDTLEEVLLSMIETSTPEVLIGDMSQVKITIIDDEMVSVQYNASSYALMEGAGSSVLGLQATLPSGGSEVPIVVANSPMDITARETIDYTQASNMSTFPANMSFSELVYNLINDSIPEEDEVFGVTIVPVSPRVTIDVQVANVTIVNDDACPCLNGGECIFFPINDTLRCACTAEYVGQTCQTRVAEPFEEISAPIVAGVTAGVVGIAIIAIAVVFLVIILCVV